jgi:hypothetical protein
MPVHQASRTVSHRRLISSRQLSIVSFNCQRSIFKETVMTAIRRIFRPVTRLAAAAVALLAGIFAAPAAFAMNVPPPGLGDTGAPAAPAVVHTVTVGGTPGWQIALFIVAAAVLAAVFAVLLDRARSARRQQVATSTP